MSRKLLLLMFLALLIGTLNLASMVEKVEASGTIYIRADGSIDQPTAPISTLDNVTYTLTNNITSSGDGIIVERDNIMIDGNGFIIQGDGDLDGVYLGSVDNVTIKNMTVALFDNGIHLSNSSGSRIAGNNITNSAHQGILLQNSSSISIFENRIDYGGIDLSYSPNCSIWKNNVNYGGIHLFYSSYCNISENIIDYGGSIGLSYSSYANITRNSGGIVLSDSSFCIISGNSGAISLDLTSQNVISDNNVTGGIELLYSNFNVVVGNNITTQFLGVSCMRSVSNSFHHNNFVNNARPVFTDTSANFWDDGLEGNYWSNYNGTDSDRDGIGDAKCAIDMNNQDNYPLMGMFSDFNATSEHYVQTICNSSISDFQFNGTAISFSVTGENGTEGFCRLCIPTALMNATYTVFVNGTEVSYNLLPCSNETYSYVYFNYTHSTEGVIIIPEFPSLLILSVLTIAILLTAIVYRRKNRISDVR